MYKDRSGQRNGRLVAIKMCGRHANGKPLWLCQCDCGNQKIVEGRALCGAYGTRSCGCLLPDMNKLRPVRDSFNIKHGESKRKTGPKSPEYVAWSSMNQRCSDSSWIGWINYGGRGIKVCATWKTSYESFLADMGRKPSPKHSLDRIDVNGNYTPENCRWADDKRQANNRRNTQYAAINGVRMTCAEISEQFNISPRTVANWIISVGNGNEISEKLSNHKKLSRPRLLKHQRIGGVA